MERDLRAEGWGPEDCYPETTEGSNSASAAGSDAGYEAATIMALRIVEFMQTFNCDAEMVLGHFIGKIGQYERELMEREGIEISI